MAYAICVFKNKEIDVEYEEVKATDHETNRKKKIIALFSWSYYIEVYLTI